MSINKRVALIAQLGERQTEDLKVHSSILCQSMSFFLWCTKCIGVEISFDSSVGRASD